MRSMPSPVGMRLGHIPRNSRRRANNFVAERDARTTRMDHSCPKSDPLRGLALFRTWRIARARSFSSRRNWSGRTCCNRDRTAAPRQCRRVGVRRSHDGGDDACGCGHDARTDDGRCGSRFRRDGDHRVAIRARPTVTAARPGDRRDATIRTRTRSLARFGSAL